MTWLSRINFPREAKILYEKVYGLNSLGLIDESMNILLNAINDSFDRDEKRYVASMALVQSFYVYSPEKAADIITAILDYDYNPYSTGESYVELYLQNLNEIINWYRCGFFYKTKFVKDVAIILIRKLEPRLFEDAARSWAYRYEGGECYEGFGRSPVDVQFGNILARDKYKSGNKINQRHVLEWLNYQKYLNKAKISNNLACLLRHYTSLDNNELINESISLYEAALIDLDEASVYSEVEYFEKVTLYNYCEALLYKEKNLPDAKSKDMLKYALDKLQYSLIYSGFASEEEHNMCENLLFETYPYFNLKY